MRKLMMALAVLMGFLMTNCKDDDNLSRDELRVKNEAEIQAYLQENNLTSQSSISGLHWVIEQEGNGEFPNTAYDPQPSGTTTTKINVTYKGYDKSGEKFDEGSNVNFTLASLVLGWREGISKFSKGGSGKLIVPSHLAYKDRAPSKNSFIVFDMTLNDFE